MKKDVHAGTSFQSFFSGRPWRVFERCFYNIDKTDPSDPLRRKDYWRQTLKTMVLYGLNIEGSVWWVFLCLLFYIVTSVFYTVMSACFQDFYFGITKFVLSVCIVASVVVSILSLLPLILLSLSLLFALVILLLSLYSPYFLFYPYFNVIVIASILPILIIEVEPSTICTLTTLYLALQVFNLI